MKKLKPYGLEDNLVTFMSLTTSQIEFNVVKSITRLLNGAKYFLRPTKFFLGLGPIVFNIIIKFFQDNPGNYAYDNSLIVFNPNNHFFMLLDVDDEIQFNLVCRNETLKNSREEKLLGLSFDKSTISCT